MTFWWTSVRHELILKVVRDAYTSQLSELVPLRYRDYVEISKSKSLLRFTSCGEKQAHETPLIATHAKKADFKCHAKREFFNKSAVRAFALPNRLTIKQLNSVVWLPYAVLSLDARQWPFTKVERNDSKAHFHYSTAELYFFNHTLAARWRSPHQS